VNERIWTMDYTRARYIEVALRIGATPKCEDQGAPIYQAIHRLGFTQASFARLVGLIPNQHKCPRMPLPDGWNGFTRPTVAKPERCRVVEDELQLAKWRALHERDWRRGRFRVLGSGPHREIRQPSQEMYMPHVIGPRRRMEEVA
jgi:hypothetical protein